MKFLKLIPIGVLCVIVLFIWAAYSGSGLAFNEVLRLVMFPERPAIFNMGMVIVLGAIFSVPVVFVGKALGEIPVIGDFFKGITLVALVFLWGFIFGMAIVLAGIVGTIIALLAILFMITPSGGDSLKGIIVIIF